MIWVTENVQKHQPAEQAISLAPLWGLLRVAMQEYPTIDFRLVDMEALIPTQKMASRLVDTITHSGEEQQLLIQQSRTYVLRFAPYQQQEAKNPIDFSESSILITGGLGSMGIQTAKHLAEKHQVAHLILLGRKQINEAALEAIEQIEQLGAQVSYHSCDISSKNSLAEVLKSIPSKYPLKGVIHAAGTLDDGLLVEQNAVRFEQVMQTKIDGTWNLHDLTKDLNLELFVNFSSISSWFGASGQGNYAAANAFLDAFSQYRNGLGLPTLTINWGPVDKVGMATRLAPQAKAQLAHQGIDMLDLKKGLALMDYLILQQATNTAIVPLRKQKMQQAFEKRLGKIPAFFSKILQTPTTKNTESDLVKQLSQLTEEKRSKHLIQSLQQEIAQVLGISNVKEVNPEKPLQEFGLDSMMAVELRNKLAQQAQLQLPSTLLFDYPTIAELSSYLLEHIQLDQQDTTWDGKLKSFLQEQGVSLDDQGENEALNQALQHLTELLKQQEATAKEEELTEEKINDFSDEEVEVNFDKLLEDLI